MANEPTTTLVNLNHVVDLLKLFNREKLGSIIDPGVLADCDGRCGCVGGNCECRGGVYSRWDRSWVELVADRQTRINDLKRELSQLEDKG